MKDWIKIIVMILVVIVIIFLGYFLFAKFTSKNNVKKEEEKVINVKKDKYNLGDEIIFTKLEDVMFTSADDRQDFSKWRVLSQNKNYLTLYSVADWGKINVKSYYNDIKQHRKIMEQYKVFTGYDNDFRLLGNKELDLFRCNTYNMTCLDVPEWIGDTMTSVVSNKSKPVVFNNNEIGVDSISDEIVYHPIITISKDRIE